MRKVSKIWHFTQFHRPAKSAKGLDFWHLTFQAPRNGVRKFWKIAERRAKRLEDLVPASMACQKVRTVSKIWPSLSQRRAKKSQSTCEDFEASHSLSISLSLSLSLSPTQLVHHAQYTNRFRGWYNKKSNVTLAAIVRLAIVASPICIAYPLL